MWKFSDLSCEVLAKANVEIQYYVLHIDDDPLTIDRVALDDSVMRKDRSPCWNFLRSLFNPTFGNERKAFRTAYDSIKDVVQSRHVWFGRIKTMFQLPLFMLRSTDGTKIALVWPTYRKGRATFGTLRMKTPRVIRGQTPEKKELVKFFDSEKTKRVVLNTLAAFALIFTLREGIVAHANWRAFPAQRRRRDSPASEEKQESQVGVAACVARKAHASLIKGCEETHQWQRTNVSIETLNPTKRIQIVVPGVANRRRPEVKLQSESFTDCASFLRELVALAELHALGIVPKMITAFVCRETERPFVLIRQRFEGDTLLLHVNNVFKHLDCPKTFHLNTARAIFSRALEIRALARRKGFLLNEWNFWNLQRADLSGDWLFDDCSETKPFVWSPPTEVLNDLQSFMANVWMFLLQLHRGKFTAETLEQLNQVWNPRRENAERYSTWTKLVQNNSVQYFPFAVFFNQKNTSSKENLLRTLDEIDVQLGLAFN